MKLRRTWPTRTVPTSVDESDERDCDGNRRLSPTSPQGNCPNTEISEDPATRRPPKSPLDSRQRRRPTDVRSEMLTVAGRRGRKATASEDVSADDEHRRSSPAQRTQSDRSFSAAVNGCRSSTSGRRRSTTTTTQPLPLHPHRSRTDHVTEGQTEAVRAAATDQRDEDGVEAIGKSTDDDVDDEIETVIPKSKSVKVCKKDDFSRAFARGCSGFQSLAADKTVHVGIVDGSTMYHKWLSPWNFDDEGEGLGRRSPMRRRRSPKHSAPTRIRGGKKSVKKASDSDVSESDEEPVQRGGRSHAKAHEKSHGKDCEPHGKIRSGKVAKKESDSSVSGVEEDLAARGGKTRDGKNNSRKNDDGKSGKKKSAESDDDDNGEEEEDDNRRTFRSIRPSSRRSSRKSDHVRRKTSTRRSSPHDVRRLITSRHDVRRSITSGATARCRSGTPVTVTATLTTSAMRI